MTTDIIHRISIKAPASRVYAALSSVEGIAGWWTRHTTGNTNIGGSLTVRFLASAEEPGGAREKGRMNLQMSRLEPAREVRWHVTEGPEEWIGTDITFTLTEADGQTIVLFGHRRWREAVEFMAHCSMKWATFLLSLRQYAETGSGRPAPDDLKIDNWN